MAMMDPGNWNGQEHNLQPAQEDDFQQFLDMSSMPNLGDGLQFDFQDYSAQNGGGSQMMHAPHRESIDTPMSGTDSTSVVARPVGAMQQHPMTPITSAPSHPTVPSQMIAPSQGSNDTISEIDAQIQYLQHQRLQQQHRQMEEQRRHFNEQQAAFYARQQQSMIPPTPQSLDLQAGNPYYNPQDPQQQQQQQNPQQQQQGPSQQQQAQMQQNQQQQQQGQPTPQGGYDRFQRFKEQQDMAFTPLVSPAVTPHDSQFPTDAQYTVPGAYFSPLTSPALHAQSESISSFEHRNSGTATSSPQEMELEPSNPAPTSGIDMSKKVRKGTVAKARKPTNVRQSPISKPQRRKTASTPIMNAQILSELVETATVHPGPQPPKPKSVSTNSADDSENASVSPEALTDMPPPPIPQSKSALQSPYMPAQNANRSAPHPLATSINGKPSPATPASLFKMSPSSRGAEGNNPDQMVSDHIENFELPESVNFSKPTLPPLVTQAQLQAPPEIETAKVSALQPLPSPVFPKPMPQSASQSPQLTPKLSSSNPRKTPLMAPRGSKKRASISSVHVSPALRPKISPSIKPLLPGTPGLSAEDTASRLLASKSNYQNILEGNTVPGVSYPSELSTNLTSKRTSHKIAEQGRRNRINSALYEIAQLLPEPLKEKDAESESGGDKKKNKASSIPNSKASTVELAIEYIKQLQQEVADANKRADEAEKQLGLQTAA